LVFDVDNGTSIEYTLNLLDNYGILPNYILGSSSDSIEKRKYRIIFKTDMIVKDQRLFRDLITDMMKYVFIDSEGNCYIDKACKNEARRWFQHSGIIYQNPDPLCTLKLLSLFELLRNLSTKVYFNDDKVKNIKEGKNYQDLVSNKKCGENGNSIYIIYRNPSQPILLSANESKNNPKNSKMETLSLKEREKFEEIQGVEFRFDKKTEDEKEIILDNLKSNFGFFKSLMEYEKVKYEHLLIICINMKMFRGGLELVKEKMNEFDLMNPNNKYNSNEHNLTSIVRKYKNYGSLDYYNLIYIEKNPEPELIDIKEAEKQVEEIFNLFEQGEVGTVFIGQIPCAVGKSEWLAQNAKNCIIGFPNHKLKNEFSDRMNGHNNSHLVVPELPTGMDASILNEIDLLYSLGLHKDANIVLRDIVKNDPDSYEAAALSDYFKRIDICNHNTGNTLTTHARLCHTQSVSNKVIFDETPISQLLQIKSVVKKDISELMQLMRNHNMLKNAESIQALIDSYEKTNMNNIFKLTIQLEDIDKVRKIIKDNKTRFSDGSNLMDFFYCYSFHIEDKVIEYVIKNKDSLNKNKKYLILTASPTKIEKQFIESMGLKVKEISIDNIKHNSTIIQYKDKSFSRTGLQLFKDNDPKGFEAFQTRLEEMGLTIITYKKFVDLFLNANPEIYFGNCSGFDELKGQDLIIIGTNNINDKTIQLYASSLGMEFSPMDIYKKEYVNINNKYGSFKYFTYHNQQLQDIHISFIESELIQAVGRSRYLRCNVNIYIFSDYLYFPETILKKLKK